METSRNEKNKSKNINSPVDGLGAITATSRSGTPLETSTENPMLNKPDDNLSQIKDKYSESRIPTTDNVYEHTSISDDTSIQRNKNLSSHEYGHQDSSDNDDDDEVNDLFKQIRKMSNRSGSQGSNDTSFKRSQEKTKSSNPFLEPFHRHSSVDMKGKIQLSEYLILHR